MLSKTLIVCLLAFLCLNVATAERLDTRIAGASGATEGQFPYIAFLTYNYQDPASNQLVSQQFTGIIYSSNSIITSANNFDSFAAIGSTITVQVGSVINNRPVQAFQYAATVGRYDIVAGGAAPSDLIVIPTQYTAGQISNNIAIVKLPAGSVFDLTNPEVEIANFPTSSPLRKDNLYAVAYGNQVPGGATFPVLKFTKMNFKRATFCQQAFANNSLSIVVDRSQHFCVQSRQLTATNNVYEGVCKLDAGGAIVRTSNPQDTSAYYEVVGILSYADDPTTCNPTTRVPAVIEYLSVFQNFFTAVVGDLATVGNGQDATANPNSRLGNFICGNGVVEEPREKCDPTDPSTLPCCNVDTCTWKQSGKLCEARTNPIDVCLTRKICDQQGVCANRIRNQNKECDNSGSKCSNGVCGSA